MFRVVVITIIPFAQHILSKGYIFLQKTTVFLSPRNVEIKNTFQTNLNTKMFKMKRFNFATLVLTSAVCSALAIMAVSFRDKQYVQNEQAPQAITALSAPSCATVTHRLDGYQFIKPLLYNDQTCELGNYDALKANIENAISQYKQAGKCGQYIGVFKTIDYPRLYWH